MSKTLKCSGCGKRHKAVESDGTVQAYCKTCKNLEIVCAVCGGHLTHSNQYGMFCDKECGLAEAQQYDAMLNKLIDDIEAVLP